MSKLPTKQEVKNMLEQQLGISQEDSEKMFVPITEEEEDEYNQMLIELKGETE